MQINYKRTTHIFATAFILSLLMTIVVIAGSNDPPEGPSHQDSQMYTLEQIYQRLVSGSAGEKMENFTEPATGPGITMHTLNDIMNVAPVINASGAMTSEVKAGKTFWGLTEGEWGLQTGTLQDIVIVYGDDDDCPSASCYSKACCDLGSKLLVGGLIANRDLSLSEGPPNFWAEIHSSTLTENGKECFDTVYDLGETRTSEFDNKDFNTTQFQTFAVCDPNN